MLWCCLSVCPSQGTCGATDHYIVFEMRKRQKCKHPNEPTIGQLDRMKKFILDVCSRDWSMVFDENDANNS